MCIHVFSLRPQIRAEGNWARWGQRPTCSLRLEGKQSLHGIVDHPGGDRVAREAGRVVDVEFVHQVLAVLLHRLDADAQIVGNLLVQATGDDTLEHLGFAARQLGQQGAERVIKKFLWNDLGAEFIEIIKTEG